MRPHQCLQKPEGTAPHDAFPGLTRKKPGVHLPTMDLAYFVNTKLETLHGSSFPH